MLSDIVASMPFLWRGLFVTIEVSVLVIVASLIAGLLLGIAVTYGPLPARVAIRVFSDVIRGIPHSGSHLRGLLWLAGGGAQSQ